VNEYSYYVRPTDGYDTYTVELRRGRGIIQSYEFGTRGAADRFGLRWLTDVIKFPPPANL